MMPRFEPLRNGSVTAAGLSLTCLLMLSACGEKSVTTTAPQPNPRTGTVLIASDPDSLNGAWNLAGPGGLILSGQADTTLIEMTSGDYIVTWEAVPEWNEPFPQKQELASGGEISFLGVYAKDNPFSGLEFGTDATLEVVTWNIEHFPKNDQVTVDLVARAIMAMDVDILALQEIESAFYFEDLDEKLASWTGVRATSAAYGSNLAFLYREGGDWVVDSVREIFTASSREFPRSPYVLEGRFKGTPVVVINNHFKCCGDNYIAPDPWDEEARRRDAGILLDEYVRNNFQGRKLIIVGDLNDSLIDSPANNVFNVFLDDPVNWRFVDLGIAQGPSSGWSFPGWPSHLDHILITQPLFTAVDGQAAAINVLRVYAGFPGGLSEYDHNMSDHLPVALKLVP